MTNPLLEFKYLPPFSQIKPEHVEPAMDTLIKENLQQLEKLLAQSPPYTWDNLMRPLENMDDKIDATWSAVNHMNAVVNSKALRTAHQACLPKLSDYSTQISHNEKLYQAIKSLAESAEFKKLNAAQQKVISNQLRDFRLAGIALSEKDKQRFAQLQKELSLLANKFEEHVLDATEGWVLQITDAAELSGLPEHAIAAAKEVAQRRQQEGWIFTLELPSYIAILMFADSRSLREKMYTAYITRASDQGPHAGTWDNSQIMQTILQKRHEIAELLGFKNYAELSLATKMAKKPQQVLDFLNELAVASLEKARTEFEELQNFARTKNIHDLQAWDIAYFSEKLQQEKYAISQEDLRPYFPENHVIAGLFAVVQSLYGLDIREEKNPDVWHSHVRFFTIYDAQKNIRGQFYLDLYARIGKRGGAWMDECRVRRRLDNGDIQTPVAYLTCNFNPPVGNDPALFTHDDVLTLFHEFGHGLQHLLTTVDYADVSGINGIPWDAVELASQFMENWCWEEEGLQLTAKHYQTQKHLPEELFHKLNAAKNFQAAMQMVRQLEFSLFDFRIHQEYDAKKTDQVQTILNEVRKKISVVPVVNFNRFQHSFTHIFSGGYAAGYYSYKWAEVLSSDAFSKFEENGIFDAATGKLFLQTILETGGTEEPEILFERFRGRPPKIDALLRHNGITTT
jgi:oligopeptidase A